MSAVKMESENVSTTNADECKTDREMRHNSFLQILHKLYQLDESIPFREPINSSDLLSSSISQPMDLVDIETALKSNRYTDPWQFLSDVWTIFENAWLYNRESSKVYRCCTKLADVFEQEASKIMRSMGYCCGRWYTFSPLTLDCSGKKSCSIPKNAKYYDYQNECTFCAKCFLEAPGTSVKYEKGILRKDQFVERKNDSFEVEPFVECVKCGKKVHQICVLYVERMQKERFICDGCETNPNKKPKLYNEYSAKLLTITKLSQHLQTRVDDYLSSRNVDNARLTIRVVSSSKKIARVKNEMMKRFVVTGRFPEGFPYTTKTIFVFQELDGIDICIFGMHVQEYDSACPEPNRRRVYLSYLDSVNFFQPKEFRTGVYHTVLLAYLEYIKQLGYKTMHVWACPPPPGDDYLFYRHPEKQITPDHKRLDEWYTKLLQRGIAERIILSNLDFLRQDPSQDGLKSLIFHMPYFENDFWPNVLEESLKEVNERSMKEDEQIRNLKACSDTSEHSVGNVGSSVDVLQLEACLRERVHAVNEEQKEVFFVFELHPSQSVPTLPAIEDPDPLINCQFMENRDTFLIVCREKHYEFSSLRRAKYSSLVLLYELHSRSYEKENKTEFIYTCDTCAQKISAGYHCTVCDDFDLCISCWNRNGHEHKMELLNSNNCPDQTEPGVERGTNLGDVQVSPDPEKLTHACLCRDRSCNMAGCAHMKRLISHFTTCQIKVKSSCPLCQQLLGLCWRHAKLCQDKKCAVPVCDRIKQKLGR